VLCGRAGIGGAQLALAWKHADQDCDGRLTFPEFVALVHSVSCCREGLELPPLERGLPSELRAALDALTQTPEELDRQRSRSPSHSASNSRSASPAPVSAPPPRRTAPPAAALESRLGGEARHHRSDRYGDKAAAAGPAEADIAELTDATPPPSPSSPRFGEDQLRGEAKAASGAELRTVGGHLRAMAASDRDVLRHIAGEADALERLVRSTREACAEVAPQLMRERDEARRLAELLRQLKLQVSGARQRLTSLQEERRALASEPTRCQHRKRFEEMHAFMRQTLEEEERVVEETRLANRQLEGSCKSLADDVAALERQRQGILEELLKEEESHREDQRELVGLRADRHQEAAAAGGPGRGEGPRSRFTGGAPLPALEAGLQFSSGRSESPWASSLVGGNIFAPPVRAQGPWPSTGDPHGHQGV